MFKKRKLPKKKKLATLLREERDLINAGQQRLDEAAALTQMLADGQRYSWYQLLRKYEITTLIDFDPKTGNVYEKAN